MTDKTNWNWKMLFNGNEYEKNYGNENLKETTPNTYYDI
jgi:hypothetical protein